MIEAGEKMDRKTWLWRKTFIENTTVATGEKNQGIGEETLARDKVELERDLKVLNANLSSVLSECNSKDDLTNKNVKIAQEAIAGWEQAETEATSIKQELDKALQQRVVAEERLAHLELALRECMQQLRFVREEQEQRIQDALIKSSREYGKKQMVLEEKLEKAEQKLTKCVLENTHMTDALIEKEKFIKDLNQHKTQIEADSNALTARLDSLEKDNASLKYEVRVLGKELEIRNEERDYNQRMADASHKQHLESVKKISKLESECQRLRLLLRKRLPGPAALVKMKHEIELLKKEPTYMRKSISSPRSSTEDFAEDILPDTHVKWIGVLTEQLQAMEQENKVLKGIVNKKVNEVQLCGVMSLPTALKHPAESPKGHQAIVEMRGSLMPREVFMGSTSDIGTDDKVSCAESWASAPISEMDHYKNGKPKGIPSGKKGSVSDINLMDDFVEMERLTLVSVGEPLGNSYVSANRSNAIVGHAGTGVDILTIEKADHFQENIKKSVSKIVELIEGISLSSQENISLGCSAAKGRDILAYKTSEPYPGYTVRVFQWKISELRAILQNLVHSCYDLLHGSVHIETFFQEITSSLDWILKHSYSLQEVSSMGDGVKNHFDWESESVSSVEKSSASKERLCFPTAAALNWHNSLLEREDLQFNASKGNKTLIDELMNLELEKKGLEGRLQETTNQCGSYKFKLQDYEKIIASLEAEVKEYKLVNGDIDTKLEVAKIELDEATQNLSSLQLELVSKNNHCEKLEATCLELQLQLESVTKKEVPKNGMEQEQKTLLTDWEITEASEKLAECQETILNLGKQLKALASASPGGGEADLLNENNEICTPMNTNTSTLVSPTFPKVEDLKHVQRHSLLDRMLAENVAEEDGPHAHLVLVTNETEREHDDEALGGSLAVVPRKKRGGPAFMKKLLSSRRKSSSKSMAIPFAA